MGKELRAEYIFDENCWNEEPFSDLYNKSKTMAEKEAWSVQKGTGRFELVTICPSIVIGPIISNSDFTSGKFVKDAILGKGEPLPENFGMPFVDVRDVAKAHLMAVLVPQAAGERFILHNA